MLTHTEIIARVAAFERAIRAEIAACDARGERYDPAPTPQEDADSTASENRTMPGKRFTARIQVAEQRQLLHRERIAQNTYHRNNAIDFEREQYAALGLAG